LLSTADTLLVEARVYYSSADAQTDCWHALCICLRLLQLLPLLWIGVTMLMWLCIVQVLLQMVPMQALRCGGAWTASSKSPLRQLHPPVVLLVPAQALSHPPSHHSSSKRSRTWRQVMGLELKRVWASGSRQLLLLQGLLVGWGWMSWQQRMAKATGRTAMQRA
jgi:hypothetical protein